MSANPHRRKRFGLFAAAPLAAAAVSTPPSRAGAGLLRRLSPGFAADFSRERFAGLGRLVDGLDASPLSPAGEDLTSLVRALDAAPSRPGAGLRHWAPPRRAAPDQYAEAHAIAALASIFPSKIAAYRSFGAPMRRRLYVELLTRESERLAAASAPPPMPPASLGPDA